MRGHQLDLVGLENLQQLTVIPQRLQQLGKRFTGNGRLWPDQREMEVNLIDTLGHQ
ncbi:hypothetical protein D3C80_2021210 [compost metagenome]